MKKIVLIGGGGHCKSVIDVIRSTKEYEIVGVLDKEECIGEEVLGYKIIGTDSDIPKYAKLYRNFAVTVGQIKSSLVREKIFKKVKEAGGDLPVIIAQTAYVSNFADLLDGNIVHHNSFVNAGVKIGRLGIINSGSIVEHDTDIGDFCHISTNSTVNGDCKIGSRTFIGSGSTVNHGVSIGDNVVVSSATLVRKNIKDNSLVVGNPMKVYRG